MVKSDAELRRSITGSGNDECVGALPSGNAGRLGDGEEKHNASGQESSSDSSGFRINLFKMRAYGFEHGASGYVLLIGPDDSVWFYCDGGLVGVGQLDSKRRVSFNPPGYVSLQMDTALLYRLDGIGWCGRPIPIRHSSDGHVFQVYPDAEIDITNCRT